MTPTHIKEQAVERFEKQFILVSSDTTKSGYRLDCDPEFAKDFLLAELSLAIQSTIKEVREWAKEDAMPQDSGWEDEERTIGLPDLLSLLDTLEKKQ